MKRTRRRDDDDDDDDDDAQSSSAATSSSASTGASIDLPKCLTGDQNVAMADLTARAAALSIDTGDKSRERLCYEVAVNEWERGGDADNATWRQRWAAVRNHMDVLERLGVLQQGALCKYGDFIEDPDERAAAIRDGKLPILDLLQEPIAPDDVVTVNNRCMSRKFLFEWFRSGQDRTTNPRNPYTKEEMSRQDVAATGFDPMRLRAFNINATEYRFEKVADFIEALNENQQEKAISILRSGLDVKYSINYDGGVKSPFISMVLSNVIPLRGDVLQMLIYEGAPMDAVTLPKKSTLTHLAAKWQPKEIMDILIKHGAPFDTKNTRGRTPLEIAIKKNRKDIIDTLVDAGANANNIDILEITLGYAPELLEYMFSKGLDVNVRNAFGRTLLHSMAAVDDTANAVHLIEVNADVNAQTPRGKSPLHIAARKGNVEVVNQLLAAGADPTLRTQQGKTAEDVAKEYNHPLVVQALQNYGAS